MAGLEGRNSSSSIVRIGRAGIRGIVFASAAAAAMFMASTALAAPGDSLYDLGEVKVVGNDRSSSKSDDTKRVFDAAPLTAAQRRVPEEKLSFIENAINDSGEAGVSLEPGEGFNSFFDAAYGSRDTSRFILKDDLAAPGDRNLDLYFEARRFSTDGYREHDGKSMFDVSMGLGADGEDGGRWKGEIGVKRARNYMNGPVFMTARTSRFDDSVFDGSVGYRISVDKSSDFSLDLGLKSFERVTDLRDYSSRTTLDNKAFTAGAGYNLMLSGTGMFTVGYEYLSDNLALDETVLETMAHPREDLDFSNHRFRVQRDIDISDDSRLTLKALYDVHSEQGNFFSPSAKLIFSSIGDTEFSLEGGKGFDLRKSQEALLSGDFAIPGLERRVLSHGYDFIALGASHTFDDSFSGGFSLSHKKYGTYGFLEDDPSGIEQYHLRYAPGDVKALAFDLNGTYRFSDKLKGSFAYLYDNRELPGGSQVPLLPKNSFRLDVVYDSGRGLVLKLTDQFIGRRFADSANTRTMESYSTMNARLSLNYHENIEPYLEVSNLLGKDFEERKGYPGQPRTILGGIRISF